MSYTVTANIDGEERIFKADSYENALECYRNTELDYIFSSYIEGIKITRDRDGLLMFDSTHDYQLQLYESVSVDKWEEKNYLLSAPSDKPSVYLDVDGTLAFWHKDGKGLSYPEEMLDPKYHYYRDLEPHKFLVDLAKELNDTGIDVCILSATDRNCFNDRWEWIEKNLPFLPKKNIFFCPIGADKTKFCKGNSEISILIDDYEKNLEEWDGFAVKSINNVNSVSKNFFNIMTAYYEMTQVPDEYEKELHKLVSSISDCVTKLEQDADSILRVKQVTNYSQAESKTDKIYAALSLPKSETEKIKYCMEDYKGEDISFSAELDSEKHLRIFAEFENLSSNYKVEISGLISDDTFSEIKNKISDITNIEIELAESRVAFDLHSLSEDRAKATDNEHELFEAVER